MGPAQQTSKKSLLEAVRSRLHRVCEKVGVTRSLVRSPGTWIALCFVALAVGSASSIALREIRNQASARQTITDALIVKNDLDGYQAELLDANANLYRYLGEKSARDLQYVFSTWRLHDFLRDAKRHGHYSAADAREFHDMEALTNRWADRARQLVERSDQSEPLDVSDPAFLALTSDLDALLNSVASLRDKEYKSGVQRVMTVFDNGAKTAAYLLESTGAAIALLLVAFLSKERASQLREAAMREAQRSESRYKKLYDMHPLPMWLYDEETLQFLSCNAAAVRHYGYSLEQFQSMKVWEMLPQEEYRRLREHYETTAGQESPGSQDGGVWRHKKADGSIVHINVKYLTLEENGRPARLSVLLDVTEQLSAEARLHATKQTLECVIDNVPQRISWKDTQSRYLGGNSAFATDVGLAEAAQLVGKTDFDLTPDEAAFIQENDRRVLAGRMRKLNSEETTLSADGTVRWQRKTMIPLRARDNTVIGVFSAYEDITERKGTELALRLQSRALESSINAIVLTQVTPVGDIIEYVNPAFERLYGYTPAEANGRNIRELGWPQALLVSAPELAARAEEGKEVSALLRSQRKDGSTFWNQLYLAPVKDPHGRITHRVAVFHDVTELLDSQERLREQATIDGLTRLPNRALLQTTLETALQKADRAGENVAVLFLDLDHFKHINDSLGHGTGDKLLATVGARLSSCLDAVDTVARYGGDEFVLVVPNSGARDLTGIVQRVLASLSEPLFIDSHELYIAGSIGMSEFPQDGRDAETLLKNADVAMYRAKQLGRNGFRRYQADLQANPDERLALYSRLHRAVSNDELVLQYQPQVDMVTGEVVGVEALVRWRDPERGLIPPNVFIPVAEDTGLIHKIGDWVLRTACLQSIAWINAGLTPVRMSVNVSPLQIQRLNICEWVEGVLSETGLDPSLLELEVTEGAIMDNPGEVTNMFVRLRAMGVHIAIDDFGTGYSSLSYLKKFKVDRIKIDRAFVRDLGTDHDDEAITRAIIGLARTLNFEVLAEGVETEAHRDFLMEYGCTMAQGYLYSRPVDAEAFAAHLTAAVPTES